MVFPEVSVKIMHKLIESSITFAGCNVVLESDSDAEWFLNRVQPIKKYSKGWASARSGREGCPRVPWRSPWDLVKSVSSGARYD